MANPNVRCCHAVHETEFFSLSVVILTLLSQLDFRWGAQKSTIGLKFKGLL